MNFLTRTAAFIALGTSATILSGQPIVQDAESRLPISTAGMRIDSNPALWSQFGEFVESLQPIQIGPALVRPHPYEKFIYSDGLLFGSGRTTNSYINRLALGALADFGNNWTIDYTPTWVYYTNPRLKDSIEQSFQGIGSVRNGDWYFQISELYSLTNSPDIETGTQTQRQSTITSFNASHIFTDRLSIDLGISQALQFIEKSPDTYDWSSSNWLTYHWPSGLDVSAGFTIGYTDFDPGSHMEYYSPNIRLRWRVSDKLSFSATAGYDNRKTATTGIPTTHVPIYNANVFYRPFDQTKLSFRLSRSVNATTFENSSSDARSWNINLEQRLLGQFTLDAGVGHSQNRFTGSRIVFIPSSTTQNVLDQNGNIIAVLTSTTFTPLRVIDHRNDSANSYSLSLSTPFLGRGTLAVLHDWRRNRSDIGGFNFDSHQTGVEIRYRF